MERSFLVNGRTMYTLTKIMDVNDINYLYIIHIFFSLLSKPSILVSLVFKYFYETPRFGLSLVVVYVYVNGFSFSNSLIF